ncbi:MAG: PIG-L family deacetylase [Chloroflexi bacterium]|nr:PIG-L family deacetylase [Chloroflexota bacterium]
MQTVLVVAAHPDDEVLGCGATIARFAQEYEVHVVILGEGISSRYGQRHVADSAELQRLKEQSRAVAAHLGARSVSFEGLPDNRFDELPLLDLTKWVERWVEETRPEIVYTHHPGDLNLDHAITFRAVLTATRPMPGSCVRDLYAFEVPSSTEWAFQRLEPAFRPSVFVDVSTTIEAKIQAMLIYSGEARNFPHPRSAEALRAIARRWGSVAGAEYAEAFELIRSVR